MEKEIDYLLDTNVCPFKITQQAVHNLFDRGTGMKEAAERIEAYLTKYNTPDAKYSVTSMVKTSVEDPYEYYLLVDVVELQRRQADQQLARKKARTTK